MANRTGEGAAWCYIWQLKRLFVFWRRRKTKKSCSGEAGRRDDGGGCWRGAVARARDGGGMLEAVPVAAVVQRQSKFVIALLLRR